jgi:hypothetical protein
MADATNRDVSSSPPTIRVADPPERHAARIVAEMVKWLAVEQSRFEHVLAREIATGRSRLGSVIAQERLVARLRRAGDGKGLVDLRLWPGKKAGFLIRWTDWRAVTPQTARMLKEGEPVPERAWLSCEIMYFTARHPTRYHRAFLLTHHAMVRLATRCGATTPDHLLDAMREIWRGFVECADRVGAEAASRLVRLELPVKSGVAIAEREDKDSCFIIKTVLSAEMAARDAAARARRLTKAERAR